MDNDFDEFPGLTDEEVEEITRPIFEKLCDGHQPKRYAGDLALASIVPLMTESLRKYHRWVSGRTS